MLFGRRKLTTTPVPSAWDFASDVSWFKPLLLLVGVWSVGSASVHFKILSLHVLVRDILEGRGAFKPVQFSSGC